MTTSSRDYPAEVQRRIDAHLDAIDQVLAESDLPRADRLAIVGDVEHHIRDTLALRLGDAAAPTAAEVEAVLIELDPPESYADGAPPARAPAFERLSERRPVAEPPRFSRAAIIGALWAAYVVPAIVISLMVMEPLDRSDDPAVAYVLMTILVWAPALLAPFGATILGCVAVQQIRHGRGRLVGLGLAKFVALVFPVLIPVGYAVILLALLPFLSGAGLGSHGPPGDADSLAGASRIGAGFLALPLIILIADVFVIRAVLRVVRGDKDEPSLGSASSPTVSVAGRVSLALALGALVMVIALMIVAGLAEPPLSHDAMEGLAFVAMMMFLGGLICGLLGLRSASGKTGAGIAGVCFAAMLMVYMAASSPAEPGYRVTPLEATADGPSAAIDDAPPKLQQQERTQ